MSDIDRAADRAANDASNWGRGPIDSNTLLIGLRRAPGAYSADYPDGCRDLAHERPDLVESAGPSEYRLTEAGRDLADALLLEGTRNWDDAIADMRKVQRASTFLGVAAAVVGVVGLIFGVDFPGSVALVSGLALLLISRRRRQTT